MQHSKPFLLGAALIVVFSVSAPHTSAAADDPAILVKTKSSSAVYWIKGTQRHPFPLLSVYRSWFGDSFSSVKEITSAELASYTLSKNILFKKESLVKIQTDPKVYRVADDTGALEWIPSEDEFKKRGYSFKSIVDVPDAFFPDYAVAPPSDFATPQNDAAKTPTSTSTPVSENKNEQPTAVVETKPEPPKFAISGVVTAHSKTETGAKVLFTFTTNATSTAVIEYLTIDSGAASSTVSISNAAVTFSKQASVQYGAPYKYLIIATAADGSTTSYAGTFISYSDVLVKGSPSIIPPNKPLAQPAVLVGAFDIKNNSPEARTVTQFTLRFDSATNATTNVAKTVQVVRLGSDNAVGETLVEKTVGSGSSILNMLNLQKLAATDEIASGQIKRYGIVIRNLENMNLSNVTATDTFVPYIAATDFLGDTQVAFSDTQLGTLTYRLP